CHELMHVLRFVTLDKVWFVAISGEQVGQLLIAQPPWYRGICDLVAIQMQNGQDCSVTCRIEKLVGMPTGRKRPGFGLTISDNATGQQIGIIEDRPISVCDGIPQFPALVDRTRSLRRGVAWDSSGKRKLLEEFQH